MSIFRLLTSILANILNPQRASHYKLPFAPIINRWQQPETPYHQRHLTRIHTLIEIIKGFGFMLEDTLRKFILQIVDIWTLIVAAYSSTY